MMASTIPNQQKICSTEIILKSEGVFEIENFKSGYADNEEITFAAEKLPEVKILWLKKYSFSKRIVL